MLFRLFNGLYLILLDELETARRDLISHLFGGLLLEVFDENYHRWYSSIRLNNFYYFQLVFLIHEKRLKNLKEMKGIVSTN